MEDGKMGGERTVGSFVCEDMAVMGKILFSK